MNRPIIEGSPLQKSLQKSSPNIKTNPNDLRKTKGIDFDNLTDEQKKEMNLLPEVEIARYGVDVTRYKNALETGNIKQEMPPGHLQASISNPQSKKVQEDLGIEYNLVDKFNQPSIYSEESKSTRINPWTKSGNRYIRSNTKLGEGESYKDTEEFETQRIYLKKDEAKNFIKVAKTIKPTKDRFTFEILGKTLFTMPVGSEGYDFIKNNCADGVCKGLGVDSADAKVRLRGGGVVLDTLVNQIMTDGGITEPKKAWDLIMKKFGVKKKK